MKFFTDKTIKNDYLLIKIQDYRKMKDFSRWKEVFIDPGVYELAKLDSYSWEDNINIKNFLNSIPKNHYFSADYPGDMLDFRENIDNHLRGILTDKFLTKSWDNAIRYCNHPQYIITVQSKFGDCQSFKHWFDKYNDLYLEYGSEIMGLGNLCRIITLTKFMKKIIKYAFSKSNFLRIHIYGLGMRIIPYAYRLSKAYGIKLSIDNTKWTRAVNTKLKEKEGLNCSSKNRQLFFDEYMKRIDYKIRMEDSQKLLSSYFRKNDKVN